MPIGYLIFTRAVHYGSSLEPVRGITFSTSAQVISSPILAARLVEYFSTPKLGTTKQYNVFDYTIIIHNINSCKCIFVIKCIINIMNHPT